MTSCGIFGKGLILLVCMSFARSEFSPVPCDDFMCYNGAQCAEGPPDFDNHKLVDGSFLNFHKERSKGATKHCECPPRYTGVDCSIPYQECGSGQHKC